MSAYFGHRILFYNNVTARLFLIYTGKCAFFKTYFAHLFGVGVISPPCLFNR